MYFSRNLEVVFIICLHGRAVSRIVAGELSSHVHRPVDELQKRVGEMQVFLSGQHLLQFLQVYHDGKTAEELLVLVVDGLLQEAVVVGEDGVGYGRYGMA